MTKTSFSIVSIFLLLLVTTGFAYWNANQLRNKVHHYIHQVDLSLYAHRGVVTTNTPEKSYDVEAKIAKIDQQFEAGKRLEALAAYQHLLDEDPSNMEVLLRMGIIYLQEKEYQLAQETLSEVYGFKESVFSLDAAWFLALLQTEYGNLDQVETLLKEVVAGRGNYYLSAEELLKVCP